MLHSGQINSIYKTKNTAEIASMFTGLMQQELQSTAGVLQVRIRDLTILGRQRNGDGQKKLLQINGSKDSSWYIINRMNLIQF
jgi:hypothetical protein